MLFTIPSRCLYYAHRKPPQSRRGRTWDWSVLRKSAGLRSGALSHRLDAFSAANRRFTLPENALEALIERACLTGRLAGAGPQRGLPAAELLSAVSLVVAGCDQGGVPRSRQHCEHYDRAVRSPSFEMQLPSVVSLKSFVKPSTHPAFTRFNVFLRDRFMCQYCTAVEDLTFDHIIPRSKGGQPPGTTSSLPAHRAICARAT